MSEDHLDNEISLSVDITPTGIQGKAKTRAASGFDRLLGGIFDCASAPLEARAARKRAESKAEINFIEAVGGKAIKRLEADPDFADNAIENFYGTAMRQYKNKSEVVREAFKSLEHEPPSAEQTSSGPDILDESFLNRFERYAEEASTEALRVKWGKVLAAEIRKPGTFSTKVMRIVDELEPSTAQLFERICKYRLDSAILICLSGQLEFFEETALTTAGLLLDSNMGINRKFLDKKSSDNAELWYAELDDFGISIPRNTTIKMPLERNYPIGKDELIGDNPVIPIYSLTDAGFAIASILEDRQEEALYSYIKCLSQFLPSVPVSEYRAVKNQMHFVKTWRNGAVLKL